MSTESKIIQVAEFNPKIKTYIFITVAVFFLVTLVGIPLLIIWLLGVGKYVSSNYYKNLKCKLTYHHLEFKKGMMFKVEKTIPLENIQDLTFIENPILNLFDLRILKIETAGNSGAQGADMKLIGIMNSAEFKSKVLQQREVLTTENRTASVAAETNNELTISLLTEIRDLLVDIKGK